MSTTTASTAQTGASTEPHEQVTVTCPSDGRVVGTVPVHTRADVERMAVELRAAQVEWQRMGLDARCGWMHRWRDWFLDNEERLNEMVQAESGKSTADAGAELPIVYEIINYYTKHAAEFLAPEHPKPHSPTMAMKRLEIQF